NINIPEEFGLSRELFFFDNLMDQNMVAANGPFITTQGDHVVETNYMTNGIVFQIRGDLNNDEEKIYMEKFPVFKEVLKKAVEDEDFSLYNTTNQWIIKKEQTRSFDDLDSTEDIPPPEYKRHKGRVGLKSSIEGNKLYQTN
ncbi:17794_t:CDS:2, partial [Rhizophagus irregularis]